VADRKSFLLRIDSGVLEGVQRWANDDLRSLNAQIEYLLRDALRRAGRAPRPGAPADPHPAPSEPGESRGPTDPDPLTDT
jgi:hypothetical protein